MRLADRLAAANLPPEQAKGIAAALGETITSDLVTRQYFDLRLGEMDLRLKSEVRDWLITHALATIGAIGVLLGVAAAAIRLIHRSRARCRRNCQKREQLFL